MKDTSKPDKRCKYDAAFRAEALRLAEQNRSAQATARALTIDLKCIYQWQKAAQTPVAAALGATLDPATAAGCASCGPPTGGRRRSWIFQKSHLLQHAEPMSQFMATERKQSVRRLCPLLGVPASSGPRNVPRRLPGKRRWSRPLYGNGYRSQSRRGDF